jgi:chemotaxis protein MotB
VLFDKAHPRSPVNRRISIIVMTRDAEEEALRIEVPAGPATADASGAGGEPAAAPTPEIAAPAAAPAPPPAQPVAPMYPVPTARN